MPTFPGIARNAFTGPGYFDVDATLSKANVSLNDAIGIAEKEGSGQAVMADYMAKKGTMGHYDVKVLSSDGSKLTEYRVSTATGKITKA